MVAFLAVVVVRAQAAPALEPVGLSSSNTDRIAMNEVQKSQTVRLLDVVAVGPFLIYASTKLRGADRPVMLLLGILTIAYNGANYLANVNRKG